MPAIVSAYPHALRKLSVFATLTLGAACADMPDGAPTAPAASRPGVAAPRPTSRPGKASRFADQGLELWVDPTTRKLTIWSAAVGRYVHADLTPEQLGLVADLIEGSKLGDANHSATEYLDPTEYRPRDFQYSVPPGFDDGAPEAPRGVLSTRRPQVAVGTADAATVSPPLVRFRGVVAGVTPESANEDTEGLQSEGTAWSDECYDLAFLLGASRANYWRTRGHASELVGKIAKVPEAELEWRDGTPHIKFAELQKYLLEAEVKIAQLVFESVKLNVERVMYNSRKCQREIVVGPLSPNVFEPPRNFRRLHTVRGWSHDEVEAGAVQS